MAVKAVMLVRVTRNSATWDSEEHIKYVDSTKGGCGLRALSQQKSISSSHGSTLICRWMVYDLHA